MLSLPLCEPAPSVPAPNLQPAYPQANMQANCSEILLKTIFRLSVWLSVKLIKRPFNLQQTITCCKSRHTWGQKNVIASEIKRIQPFEVDCFSFWVSQCRNNNNLALRYDGVCYTWPFFAKGLVSWLQCITAYKSVALWVAIFINRKTYRFDKRAIRLSVQ